MILELTVFVIGYATYITIAVSERTNNPYTYRRLGADDVHPPDRIEPTSASI